MSEDALFRRLRSMPILRSAWRHIRSNGLSSTSPETVKDVREFEEHADVNLIRISRQLRENRFKFRPSIGVPAKKPGKSTKRPIVIAPIESRIVQRAILEVLQGHTNVANLAQNENSFGGVKDGGVQPAIEVVYRVINEGGEYFIRSDIRSFFDKIPKAEVLKIVRSNLDDEQFISIFERALEVELTNLAQLGSDAEIFPIHDVGVAQGCCLSPFVGNLLLHDFDREMNRDGIKCVRYIDDFIILAPDFSAARHAFKKANTILGQLGLQAYDPKSDQDKAEQGSTKNPKSFSFLGCEIRRGSIRPDKKALKRIRLKISDLRDASYAMMAHPETAARSGASLIDTLRKLNNMVHSWSMQYVFCNDQAAFAALDQFIDEKIGKYLAEYRKRRAKLRTQSDRRLLLGVRLASHSDAEKSIANRYHSRKPC